MNREKTNKCLRLVNPLLQGFTNTKSYQEVYDLFEESQDTRISMKPNFELFLNDSMRTLVKSFNKETQNVYDMFLDAFYLDRSSYHNMFDYKVKHRTDKDIFATKLNQLRLLDLDERNKYLIEYFELFLKLINEKELLTYLNLSLASLGYEPEDLGDLNSKEIEDILDFFEENFNGDIKDLKNVVLILVRLLLIDTCDEEQVAELLNSCPIVLLYVENQLVNRLKGVFNLLYSCHFNNADEVVDFIYKERDMVLLEDEEYTLFLTTILNISMVLEELNNIKDVSKDVKFQYLKGLFDNEQ